MPFILVVAYGTSAYVIFDISIAILLALVKYPANNFMVKLLHGQNE